jgi:hypothetical protein
MGGRAYEKCSDAKCSHDACGRPYCPDLELVSLSLRWREVAGLPVCEEVYEHVDPRVLRARISSEDARKSAASQRTIIILSYISRCKSTACLPRPFSTCRMIVIVCAPPNTAARAMKKSSRPYFRTMQPRTMNLDMH